MSQPQLKLYTESDVITPLLKSPAFAAFYEAERDNLPSGIEWVRDKSLLKDDTPNGKAVRQYEAGQVIRRVIHLPRIPPRLSDAYLVAHELSHFLLDEMGYPLPALNGGDSIHETFTSMLHDPLVSRILERYGFDIRAAFEREMSRSQRLLRRIPQEPAHERLKLEWCLTYTSALLDYDLFDTTQPHPFFIWFEARYPHTAAAAHQLHAYIQRAGFDTPATMGALLDTLLDKYFRRSA